MTGPPPDCENEPLKERERAGLKVRTPELLMTRGPPFVVVIGPTKVKAAPVTEIPEAPEVESAPWNWPRPVMFCNKTEEADVDDCAVKLIAERM